MASSSSDQPASSTGGAVAEGVGSHKFPTDELGSQIQNLKKQRQELLGEKKRLQANLRNAHRRKNNLCQRTGMLSDTDLLAIMRMREAHSSKEGTASDEESAKTSEPQSLGAAAVAGKPVTAPEQPDAAASEGNAELVDSQVYPESPRHDAAFADLS